ncbi:MAG: PepSY-like domain-containing protein, partial [Roseivirga sp.]|nr:PepSY-like domain-containing protein [Roseivirga sp.]
VDSTAFAGSDVSTWTEIDEADLPDNVLDYLEQNYTDLNVRQAWVDDSGGYVVLLQGKTAVRFDNLGVFVEAIDNAVKKRAKDRPELTEIDTASLSTSITDYIVDNYSDYIILKASTDENGAFYIKLVDGPTLIFDSKGNFTEEIDSEGHRKRRNKGKRGKSRASDQWTAIDLESLPESVSDYIATNYTDAAVEKAAVAADGNFKVWLDSQVVLLFKEDGSFLSEKTAKGSTEG